MENTDTTHIKEWLGAGSINIFGRPFAGKDTQGKKLAELLDGHLIGGGDILRGSVIPEHVKEIMRAGHLIPTEDFISIVLPFLGHTDIEDQPLILSSVGRWDGEQEGVIEATTQAGHPIKAVIYLDIDEDTVRARWNALENHDDRGGRHDDTAEVLETRLEEYREKTLPVIESYRKLGLLIEIKGDGTPEEIFEEIIRQLNAISAN